MTKTPTKSELWIEALEIMKAGKVSKSVQSNLEALFAPKTASSVNPPRKNKDGEMEYWDRWFDRYVSENEAVLSNGKPKGYSKASLSKWNKIHEKIKNMVLDLAYSGKTREETEDIIKEAKAEMNKPSSFDYDIDSKRFNSKIKYEVEYQDGKWISIETPIEEK